MRFLFLSDAVPYRDGLAQCGAQSMVHPPLNLSLDAVGVEYLAAVHIGELGAQPVCLHWPNRQVP